MRLVIFCARAALEVSFHRNVWVIGPHKIITEKAQKYFVFRPDFDVHAKNTKPFAAVP